MVVLSEQCKEEASTILGTYIEAALTLKFERTVSEREQANQDK